MAKKEPIQRRKVLDLGYIELIDMMGSDEDAIVDAARVSMDKSADQYTPEQNKKLLIYLRDHQHSSPFEMVDFKFRIMAPVAVWWHWVRHRHACLAGNTKLWFDLPANLEEGSARRYSMTIAEAYRKFTQNEFSKGRIKGMHLRSCSEDSSQIYRTHIKDIWKTGVKPTYRVTTKSGYQITCTSDHRFLSSDGWGRLGDLLKINPSPVGDPKMFTWESCELAVNGVSQDIPVYRDYDWLAERRYKNMYLDDIAAEAGCSNHTIRAWLRKHRLQFTVADIVAKSSKTQKGKRRSSPAYKIGSLKGVETKRLRGSMPSGSKHHWWKGGATAERSAIASWTTMQAKHVHEKNSYTCAACGCGSSDLVAHHIDPVWNNPGASRDESNLISLCSPCHRGIHAGNCELDFKNWLDSRQVGEKFVATCKPAIRNSPRRTTKLHVRFDSVERVEYAGEMETYDLEVEGPWHNFVADGFVVHNSYNFQSGRYVPFTETRVYRPDDWRIQSKSNKQGSAPGERLPSNIADMFDAERDALYEKAFDLYNRMLEAGVAREEARLVLPFYAVYYEAIVKMNGSSCINFIALREEATAQWEIQQYAKAMRQILATTHPTVFGGPDRMRKL